jgi:signal transduction histidine kinase
MTSAEARDARTDRRPGGLHVWPWAADAFVVFALLVGTFAQLHHDRGLRVTGPGPRFLLALALIVPLAWRRRAPLVTFALIAAVALGQSVAGPPVLADIALLWAFYSVAAYCPTLWTVSAGVALEFGVVLAILHYGTQGQDARGFFFLTALVTAAGVLGVNVKIRRAYLAAVEQRAAQLEFERDQQSQLAVAAERARIAREMHDVIAHNLTVVIALTDGAALTVERDPARAAAAITEASAAGRSALREMRQVLGVLRDTDASASLSPAPAVSDLDGLFETVRRTGLEVQFETEGRLDGLGSGLELTIYRLVQEAVTNTVKHALAPTRIVVRLTRNVDDVTVSITDDGGAPVTTGVGQGLLGMRERVAVHAGEVNAGAIATGWQVTARLPLPSRPAPTSEPAAAVSSP